VTVAWQLRGVAGVQWALNAIETVEFGRIRAAPSGKAALQGKFTYVRNAFTVRYLRHFSNDVSEISQFADFTRGFAPERC
jgi:hypothetical protein